MHLDGACEKNYENHYCIILGIETTKAVMSELDINSCFHEGLWVCPIEECGKQVANKRFKPTFHAFTL